MDKQSDSGASARRFRSRQIRRLLWVSMISMVATTAIFAKFYGDLTSAFTGGDLPVFFLPEQMAELNESIPAFSQIMGEWAAFTLLLELGILFLTSAFITYRLATPLYRVNEAIREIGEGKLYTDIELGDGDEFQSLARNLNEAVAKVQLMIMTLEMDLGTLEGMASDNTEVDRELMRQTIENSREALSYFETIDLTAFEMEEPA
ncbi:MAG: HAMP domain-containing protein [Pseudomonadota bacterium]